MGHSRITLITGEAVEVEMSAKDVQNRMQRAQTLLELQRASDGPPIYINSSHVVSIEDFEPQEPFAQS